MTEMPAHSIEPVWLVQATYAPDAVETREPFRAQHLARMARLRAAGIVVEVGAYADVSASVFLARVDTEEEALAIAREDVYLQNGVWVEVRAARFGRLRLDDAEAAGS
jgi:uncharacterized protein YciI